jgi:hypothetical protein
VFSFGLVFRKKIEAKLNVLLKIANNFFDQSDRDETNPIHMFMPLHLSWKKERKP